METPDSSDKKMMKEAMKHHLEVMALAKSKKQIVKPALKPVQAMDTVTKLKHYTRPQ